MSFRAASADLPDYRLSFAQRRTLAISVLPDGSIEVVAPLGTDIDKIRRRVGARLGWIVRQQAFFGQFAPRTPERRYVGGETHLYLGRRYRLKLGRGPENWVGLNSGRLFVVTPHSPDPGCIRDAVLAWYRRRAEVKLPERLEFTLQRLAHLDIREPELRIRPLRSRWGSMSSHARLTLNVDLIKAPTSSIDYVITHELCHLAHPDHGPAFYRLLGRVLPDWEQRKQRLERLLA